MTLHQEQVQRIKQKLKLAKKADANNEVFGASSHKYALYEPATEEEVTAFEKEHKVQLPACYRDFITQIGNGGPAYMNSAAGPFYGIYPLGENLDELVYKSPEKYLGLEPVIYPGITPEGWAKLSEKVFGENTNDQDYDLERGKLFGGVLPLGSQGCSYVHSIMLSGKHKGRVVNMDMDGQIPQFTFESNFLDWYERWLDEVIAGDLITTEATWFGYSMGGTAQKLFEVYSTTADAKEKEDALNGLFSKKSMDNVIIDQLENECRKNSAHHNTLVQLLAKNSFDRAEPFIRELESLNFIFKFIHWYGSEEKAEAWLPFIEQNISRIDDDDTFSFCSYLLQKCKTPTTHLLAGFVTHANQHIRATAVYNLGKSAEKDKYIQLMAGALNDEYVETLRYALQALRDEKQKFLLPYYKKVADRYPVETDYILSNLDNCLNNYGLNAEQIRSMSEEEIEALSK